MSPASTRVQALPTSRTTIRLSWASLIVLHSPVVLVCGFAVVFFAGCFTSCFLAVDLLWALLGVADFEEDLEACVVAVLLAGTCFGWPAFGVSVFASILAGLGFPASSAMGGSCSCSAGAE